MIQWHFAKRNIFTGKVAWNQSYLTYGLRHNCVIDQSATENTLIIDFFSHGLRSVKIEQELENYHYPFYLHYFAFVFHTLIFHLKNCSRNFGFACTFCISFNSITIEINNFLLCVYVVYCDYIIAIHRLLPCLFFFISPQKSH